MPHSHSMSISPYISVNGHLSLASHAHLNYTDRGFTLADGVFETLLIRGQTALWLEEHIERLLLGAQVLGMGDIPNLPTAQDAANAVKELLQTIPKQTQEGADGNTMHCVLRITLTRGPAVQRGVWLDSSLASPTLLMTLSPWVAPQAQRVVVAQNTRRNERSPLANIKSLGYGDAILARVEALERGATEGILLNTRDYLACATVGNVFLKLGENWFTPTLECGVLPGLARRRLLEVLNAKEVRLEPACLSEVSAAFVSNSLGCSPILELEGRALPLASEWDAIESIYFEGE